MRRRTGTGRPIEFSQPCDRSPVRRGLRGGRNLADKRAARGALQQDFPLPHHHAIPDHRDLQNVLRRRTAHGIGGDNDFSAGHGSFGPGHEVAILGLKSEPVRGMLQGGIAIAERRPCPVPPGRGQSEFARRRGGAFGGR